MGRGAGDGQEIASAAARPAAADTGEHCHGGQGRQQSGVDVCLQCTANATS